MAKEIRTKQTRVDERRKPGKPVPCDQDLCYDFESCPFGLDNVACREAGDVEIDDLMVID